MPAIPGRPLFIGVEGPALTIDEKKFIRRSQPGGFILFARNIETPEQTNELLRSLQALVKEPCFLSIDQEGGRVDRLKQILPPMPSMFKTALAGIGAVQRHASVTARALRLLGFNMNFAPVLDLMSPFRNGIEDRAFSCAPVEVAAMGTVYLRTALKAGVPGTLKHFPGLGRGECDSHLDLPFIPIKRSNLILEDLHPFRKNLRHSPFVMVAHAFYPDFEENDDRPVPASLSRNIVTRLLRKDLGFDGVALTDDLLMGALRGFGDLPLISQLAFQAGNDMLLLCRGLEACEQVYKVLARKKTMVQAKRQEQAYRRIARVKKNLALKPTVADLDRAALDGIAAEMQRFSDEVAGRDASAG
ncbi:MAG: beta-N-acetylhexosaminidase [Acidobacteria bacterium]|nr:beta-N-acetylhexosaminidase [Acidobacteriota bacterium]